MNETDCLNYFNNFYGYGNWASDFWFLGIEEGGDKHVEKIYKLKSQNFNKYSLIDNYCFQSQYTPSFFDYKVQSTWKRSIQILLFLKDNQFKTDNTTLVEFQKKHWGRAVFNKNDGIMGNAIIELLPLPVVSFDDNMFKHKYYTFFSQFKSIKYLSEKEKYRFFNWYNGAGPKRLDFIANQVEKFKPKLVVAYAKTYKTEFKQIVVKSNLVTNQQWQKIILSENKDAEFMKTRTTLFVYCYQPSAIWSNTYWEQLSKIIKLII